MTLIIITISAIARRIWMKIPVLKTINPIAHAISRINAMT
jgi:hypothetical protein